MKKSLLTLAACAMMAGTADATVYIVGDPVGVWNPAKGIEMTEADGGWKWTGTIADSQWFAFATQLVESGDWDVFNSTYRLNPPANGTVTNVGEYALTLGGKDNAFKGNGAEVTFFVKETDGAYTLTVTDQTGSETPIEPTEEVWGVVGAFNGWGGEPDFTMTKIRDGVWKATMYDFSGEFKFRANNDWEYNFGADFDGALEVDGSYPVALNGANFAISEPVEEVIFELDVINKMLKVSGLSEVSLVLRGGMNGWDFNPDYAFQEVDDNVFMCNLDRIEAGTEFKIANEDWSEEYTTTVLDMVPNEIYDLLPGAGQGNMGVDKSYTDVSMYFDLDNMIFWFYGDIATGVAVAEAAAGKARYFNLQGVEVSNPSAGIFVRVIDGRSRKVTVK